MAPNAPDADLLPPLRLPGEANMDFTDGIANEEGVPLVGSPSLDVPTLTRRLTLIDGLSVLVGVIVGSGIFTSPGVVLLYAGSVGLGFLAWVTAGAVALCGSLIYAELGSAIPLAGGNAAYFEMAFGEAWSFAFIWTMFFVLTNGSLAIVVLTCARYFVAGFVEHHAVDEDMDSYPLVKAIAIACVVVLTLCNCLGVRVGSGLQNLFSLVKVMLVTLLTVAAVVFLWRDTSVLQTNVHKPFVGSTLSGFGPSMVAALWSFCGWGDLVFLTEELKNPSKDIPLATIGGFSLVAVIYLIMNVAYLCILPASACVFLNEQHIIGMGASTGHSFVADIGGWLPQCQMLTYGRRTFSHPTKMRKPNLDHISVDAEVKTSVAVGIDATQAALGPWAGSATALLVSFSVLGAANAIILCGARYLYAAAREWQVIRWLGLLGQHSRSPYAALLAQGLMCCLLLLCSSDLVELLNYFGVASFLFYGLTAAAHMKIRRDFPDLHRPYHVTFYPYAPIIMICSSLYLVVTTFLASPIPTSLSMAFVALSFPFYFLFVRSSGTRIP